MHRKDGLDNPCSPNGPHPLYYVLEEDGFRHGPYACRREAELAAKSEDATIDPPLADPDAIKDGALVIDIVKHGSRPA